MDSADRHQVETIAEQLERIAVRAASVAESIPPLLLLLPRSQVEHWSPPIHALAQSLRTTAQLANIEAQLLRRVAS